MVFNRDNSRPPICTNFLHIKLTKLIGINKMLFNRSSLLLNLREDKATELAVILAYYTVFSITPLLIMAIAIASSIFGQEAPKKKIVGIQETEIIQL
jgi:uncharacterized BrkB/YihY/UPF0761 family membrane protein